MGLLFKFIGVCNVFAYCYISRWKKNTHVSNWEGRHKTRRFRLIFHTSKKYSAFLKPCFNSYAVAGKEQSQNETTQRQAIKSTPHQPSIFSNGEL
jgi:hypothetical protein